MSPIEIRSGLRKLEFHPDQALVEFVLGEPLPDKESVRVDLGVRDGSRRELVGEPTLIGTTPLDDSKVEYRYRLRGAIASAK